MTDGPPRPGRYHEQPESPRRRREDRQPPEERPSFSARDLAALIEELRGAEPTGRFSIPPKPAAEPTAKEVAVLRPWLPWVKTFFVISAICGAGAAVVAAILGAQDWVDHAITREVAPIRENVAQIQRDVSELLRRSAP